MDPRVMELRMKKLIPLIEDQAKNGMTKDEWCATHGIERNAFFRWQKRKNLSDLGNTICLLVSALTCHN